MEKQEWSSKYHEYVALASEGPDESLNNGNDKTSEPVIIKNDTSTEPVKITISEKAKQTIRVILDQIKTFTELEKYLLHLKLTEVSNIIDPLRQPLNPLGSRSEIYRTISWIKTHLEEDPDISLPKQQVYDEYFKYCLEIKIKALSQADFGKVMKQVYPKVRARRLGTRGNSRYCYSGLRERLLLKPPLLPDLADKPLSTEAPCSQSNLTAAAWLIVKEWSEQHFGIQFLSLQALACYLIINHSIGFGSDAANKLTTIKDSQLKDDDQTKNGIKHREMQLQLQRKIQQKHDVKERKRKMQSTKCESKINGKKTKHTLIKQRMEMYTTTMAGDNSTSTSIDSISTSPTQGKTICDNNKSLDFTQLSALPDFTSFQKQQLPCDKTTTNNNKNKINNNNNNNNNSNINNNCKNNSPAKVAIPKLVAGIKKSSHLNLFINTSPKKNLKNSKYKTIQPKLQPCDILTYNPHNTTNNAENRSQGVPQNITDNSFKERNNLCENNNSNEDDGNVVVPDYISFSRERLDSISSVDKDAMDEYLGANNSQHEEELSQYFKNNDNTTTSMDSDNLAKLSQLRRLLQQNGIPNNKTLLLQQDNNLIQDDVKLSLSHLSTVQNIIPGSSYVTLNSFQNPLTVLPSITNQQIRRRVSFETPIPDEINSTTNTSLSSSSSSSSLSSSSSSLSLSSSSSSSSSSTTIITQVPPSPNTRRKNFSFCPISPGPQSPNTATILTTTTTTTTTSSTTITTNGRQSKCSSTNVSPLVSPRNTPIVRNINNAHQNAGFMLPIQRKQQLITTTTTTATTITTTTNTLTKIKREPLLFNKNNELTLEIYDNKNNYNLAMSAPPSPMLNHYSTTKSVLQKLLNSNNKVSYTPDYINNNIKLEINDINDILNTNNCNDNLNNYRSQSVPLHQMVIKSDIIDNRQLLTTLTTTNDPTNDFNDLDPIQENEIVTVNHIINSLDEQHCDNNNLDIYNINSDNLHTYNLLVNNNLDIQNYSNIYNATTTTTTTTTTTAAAAAPPINTTNISNNHFNLNNCNGIINPSSTRSVPNTPLPFLHNNNNNKQINKHFSNHNSRSYPSTPLLVPESPFNYNSNGDCLLNGLSIKITNNINHKNNNNNNNNSNNNDDDNDKNSNNNNSKIVTNELNSNNINYFIPNLNNDNNLSQNEFISRSLPNNNDFVDIVESDNTLMDENCVLITESNFDSNIN